MWTLPHTVEEHSPSLHRPGEPLRWRRAEKAESLSGRDPLAKRHHRRSSVFLPTLSGGPFPVSERLLPPLLTPTSPKARPRLPS